MADEDNLLEASPVNGGVSAGEGSSDEEYERMTAAEVLEKLEEVPYHFFTTLLCYTPSSYRLG